MSASLISISQWKDYLIYLSDILKAENSKYLWLLIKVGYLISDSPNPPPRLNSKDKFQLPKPSTPAQPLLCLYLPYSICKARNSRFSTVRTQGIFYTSLVQNSPEQSYKITQIREFTSKRMQYNVRRSVHASVSNDSLNPICMRCINLPTLLFQCLFWLVPPAE